MGQGTFILDWLLERKTMNGNEDRLINTFEKSAQEYFKEVWEYAWTWIGVVVLFAMVLFGVYFSQFAISKIIGATGEMMLFGWAAAISISALEVAGIKLLGNKDRSNAIKASNAGEHKIAYWGTIVLFGFDIFTNLYGLWLYARPFFKSEFLSFGAWVVILFFGSVMAVSEIFVGWMFRAIATSYTALRRAKQKYDAYKKNVDQVTAKECSNTGKDIPSWRPKSSPMPLPNPLKRKGNKGKMSISEARKYRKPAPFSVPTDDEIDNWAENQYSR
jgi:ABC-type multidrug transport system fused ATPase/permease subunit